MKRNDDLNRKFKTQFYAFLQPKRLLFGLVNIKHTPIVPYKRPSLMRAGGGGSNLIGKPGVVGTSEYSEGNPTPFKATQAENIKMKSPTKAWRGKKLIYLDSIRCKKGAKGHIIYGDSQGITVMNKISE